MPADTHTREGGTTRFLRALTGYLKQTAGSLTLGSAASIVSNSLTFLPIVFLGRAIDAVIAWGNGRSDGPAAARAIALWTGAVVVVEGPRIARRWWLQTSNARIRASLRADAMRGVLGWPLARLHGVAVGDLMARIMGDVDVVGVGVRSITIDLWDTMLSAVSVLVTMVLYNPALTALSLIPVPAAMALAHAAGRWVRRRTTVAREANAALTASLQEQLAGVRVLRLFGRAGAAVERIRGHAARQAEANIAVVRLQAGLEPVYGTMMMCGVVLVVLLGGRDVVAGTMTVGAFVAYLQLFVRFANRGFRIPRFLNRLQSAGAAWDRLVPLLAPPVSMAAAPRFATFRSDLIPGEDQVALRAAQPPSGGPVAVELRSVTFRYPGSRVPALRGVSLGIPAGSFVAVTGPVGSGKSAVARAILGLYPSETGCVFWDGVSIREIPPEARAGRSGYLPQEAGLFSGTVRENVLMGLPLEAAGGADPVREALACAALEEDIAALADGLETQIGETGVRISGGQRQRVALARALAGCLPGSPRLLVLDDPFSAIDVETETRIIRCLLDRHGPSAPPADRATILLLSHRLAAFPLSDRVVVLRDGGIEEEGTHDALVRAGGLYARIFLAQAQAATGRASGKGEQ